MNYASTANIEEVMKFYNLGHKTFETDFSLNLGSFTEYIFLFVSEIKRIQFTKFQELSNERFPKIFLTQGLFIYI